MSLNGRMFFNAQAWVLKDTKIASFKDLQGKKSCHPAYQRSVGMYVPISFGVSSGVIKPVAGSLGDTVTNFFVGGSCAAPTLCTLCMNTTNGTDGNPGECSRVDSYAGTRGALRCLSESAGDVAFLRDTTFEDACVDLNASWCLKKDDYKVVQDFGQVPTNILVSVNGTIANESLAVLKAEITKMNTSDKILLRLFGVDPPHGFAPVKSVKDHLGDFAQKVACTPGLEAIEDMSSPLGCNKTEVGKTGNKTEVLRLAWHRHLSIDDQSRLISLLFNRTGLTFTIVKVNDDFDAVKAMMSDKADVADIDPAALIGKENIFSAIAQATDVRGQDYYTAQAWVKKDSGISTLEQLVGRSSCHSGMRKTAGMLLPVSHMVRYGIMPVVNDSVAESVKSYFTGGQCAVSQLCSKCKNNQTDGGCTTHDAYAGPSGALRCLIEGSGDVAFIRDTTWNITCFNNTQKPAWCPQNQAEYVMIDDFNSERIPTNMVVAKSRIIERKAFDTLMKSLFALTPEKDADLLSFFGEGHAKGFKEIPSMPLHMGDLRPIIGCAPAFTDAAGQRLELSCERSSMGRQGREGDPIRLAWQGKYSDEKAQALERLLEEATGLNFTVMAAESDMDAAQKVLLGDADLASVDPAAVVGKESSFEPIMAEVSDNQDRSYFLAEAWVLASSNITSFAQLKGLKSCHTGFQKSAGMYMPIGYGISIGIIAAGSDLISTVEGFFAKSCAYPQVCSLCKGNNTDGRCTKEDAYSQESGALRCLTEGAGDVAFVRDTSFASVCGPKVSNRPGWCKNESDYRVLPKYGLRVPTNLLIARSSDGIETSAMEKIRSALDAMNGTNRAELLSYFSETPANGFKRINSLADHMQQYRETVACVPYFEQLEKIDTPLGCAGKTMPGRNGTEADPIRIAFPLDRQSLVAGVPERMQRGTGLHFTIVYTSGDVESAEMIVNGTADLADIDPTAVFGREKYLDIVVAEVTDPTMRTFYEAQAWVRADSNIWSFQDLKGKKSCHTSFLAPAGTMLPIGYGISHGIIERKATVEETMTSFFSGGQCAAPNLCSVCSAVKTNGQCNSADPYWGDAGILSCLASGAGDVAFLRDSTFDENCGEEVDPKPAYCGNRNQFRNIQTMGAVPTRPMVTRSGALSVMVLEKLKGYFPSLTTADPGKAETLRAFGQGFTITFKEVSSVAEHIGNYDTLLSCVPGVVQALKLKGLPQCSIDLTRVGNNVDPIRLAFYGQLNTTNNFTDSLQAATGRVFRLFPAKDSAEATAMVVNKTADLALAEAPELVQYQDSLQMVVKAVTAPILASNGSVSVQAWVLKSSPYTNLASLKGARGCLGGYTSVEGSLIPIGYAVSKSIIPQSSDLQKSINDFFSKGACAPPKVCSACKTTKVDGQCNMDDTYAYASGALQCLSEGAGDVAFIRGDTYQDVCDQGSKRPAWCKDLGEYRQIATLSSMPAPALVTRIGSLSADALQDLKAGFDSLKPNSSVIQAFGSEYVSLDAMDSIQLYLRDFSDSMSCTPGAKELLNLTYDMTCSPKPGRDGSKNEPIRMVSTGSQVEYTMFKTMLEDRTSLNFQIVPASDDRQAALKIANGEADLATVDVATILDYQYRDIEAVAVETVDGFGRTMFEAQAWVRAESTQYKSMSDLKGRPSCHSGYRKSAGTLLPIGDGVQTGAIPAVNQSLQATITSFFTTSCAVPTICTGCSNVKTNGQCTFSDNYANYNGALRCLTERAGEVAFIRDTAYETTCGSDQRPTWCQPKEDYRVLQSFGAVPSPAVVTKKGALDAKTFSQIQAALARLTMDDAILIYFSDGLAKGFRLVTDLGSHIGNFGRTVACVPGIKDVVGVEGLPACLKETGRDGSAALPLRYAYTGNATKAALAAAALTQRTGLFIATVEAPNQIEAVAMVGNGQAEWTSADATAAIVASAKYNMDALAVEAHGAQLSTYTITEAWVKKAANITDMAQLQGKRTCHAAFDHGASTYLPMGYLIGQGYVTVGEESRGALEATMKTYFSKSCAYPTLCSACKDDQIDGYCGKKDTYSGLEGALRCLVDGAGDVAFITSNTFDKFCRDPDNAKTSTCKDRDQFYLLSTLGQVPSNVIVTAPNSMRAQAKFALTDALLTLNDENPYDTAILEGFGTGEAKGFRSVSTLGAHVGNYTNQVGCIPGAQYILGISSNYLPICKVNFAGPSSGSISTQTTSEKAAVSSGSSGSSDVRSVAIAAIVLGVIALLAAPILAFFIARRQYQKWVIDNQGGPGGKKMEPDTQSIASCVLPPSGTLRQVSQPRGSDLEIPSHIAMVPLGQNYGQSMMDTPVSIPDGGQSNMPLNNNPNSTVFSIAV